MRRLLAYAAALTGFCIWWRYHQPERAPMLGGFRCSECGRVGDSLDEFVPGGKGAGYVQADRPMFDRQTRTITRDGAP